MHSRVMRATDAASTCAVRLIRTGAWTRAGWSRVAPIRVGRPGARLRPRPGTSGAGGRIMVHQMSLEHDERDGVDDATLSCVWGGSHRRATLLPAVRGEFGGDTAADATGRSASGRRPLSVTPPLAPPGFLVCAVAGGGVHVGCSLPSSDTSCGSRRQGRGEVLSSPRRLVPSRKHRAQRMRAALTRCVRSATACYPRSTLQSESHWAYASRQLF